MTTAPRRLARGSAALAALITMVVGVPVGLWAMVGWPLPRTVPTFDRLANALTQPGVSDTVLLDALAVVCWIAWFVIVVSVATEVVAVVRGRVAPRIRLAGPLQLVAASLVTAVVVMVITMASRSSSPAPTAHLVGRPVPTSALASTPAASGSSSAAATLTPTGAVAQHAHEIEYVVRPRDTLWGIAQEQLGDPLRWREIFERNQGLPQPAGGVLTQARLIRPGWTLLLSAPNGADATATTAQGQSTTDTVTALGGTPTATAVPTVRPTTTTTAAPAHVRVAPATGVTSASTTIQLPSGSLVSLVLAGGVGGALAGARLRARRRRRPGDATTGGAPGTPLVRRLRRASLKGTPTPVSLTEMPVAEAGGVAVHLDLTSIGALCLTGDAAVAASRSVLLTMLTSEPTADVHIAGRALADALRPGATAFPGLTIHSSADTALTAIEVELVGRARLLDTAGVADAATFRAARPHEPLPAIVLAVGEVEPASTGRVNAILTLGPRLGVFVLAIGSDQFLAASMLSTTGSGYIEATRGEGVHDLIGARLFTLTTEEATECLGAVAGSRHDALAPAPAARPDDPDAAPAVEVLPDPSPDTDHPVMIRAFGAPRIEAAGTTISSGFRTKARELLVYLSLHPSGVAADVAIELLWPDTDPDRGVEYFRSVVGNARKVLRNATGRHDAMFIDWRDDRYVLDHDLVGSDVRRCVSALQRASSATGDDHRVDGLESAGREYTGDLAADAQYEWVETAREEIRRRVVDGLVEAAQIRLSGEEPDRAIADLEAAVRADPYCEDLYRRIMRIHRDADRRDAVRRTYRLLERRLAELDVDPDEATTALLVTASDPTELISA